MAACWSVRSRSTSCASPGASQTRSSSCEESVMSDSRIHRETALAARQRRIRSCWSNMSASGTARSRRSWTSASSFDHGEVVGLVGRQRRRQVDAGEMHRRCRPADQRCHPPVRHPTRVRLASRRARAPASRPSTRTWHWWRSFDLAENLFLGRELVRPGSWGGWASCARARWRRPAREAIARLPAQFPDLDAPIETMSGGQRQAVAISKAAFWGRTPAAAR